MNRERDFNAIARAWLDESPREAPDRVIAAVLQAIEVTPQERRPLRWLTRRDQTVNRLLLAAAAAAAIVIAVGGGTLLINSSRPQPNVASSPSPSISISPSAPAAAVPAELQYTWLGDLREVPGLETDRSVLGFSERSMDYIDVLSSDVTSSAPGQLAMTAKRSVAGCKAGDEGTYAFSLSPGGNRLTLAPIDDGCDARREALTGEWFRSDCLNTENWCLGPLEAGEYPSYFFAPRVPVADEWAPEFGALRYTVRDGWAATSDFPREYFIEPTDWYQSDQHDFSRATHGIYVGSHVVALDAGGGCGPSQANVRPTPDELAAWISAHPGLDAGEPRAITIGDHQGTIVDGAALPGWSGICAGAPTPVAILFGEAGAGADGRQWGAMVGQRNRYILLDLGEEYPVLIEISTTEDRFDELLPEAMQIVESFRFE